jgi:hypothetical protein
MFTADVSSNAFSSTVSYFIGAGTQPMGDC